MAFVNLALVSACHVREKEDTRLPVPKPEIVLPELDDRLEPMQAVEPLPDLAPPAAGPRLVVAADDGLERLRPPATAPERLEPPLSDEDEAEPVEQGEAEPAAADETVYRPELADAVAREHRVVSPATFSDREYADDRMVDARRVVYRVRLRVPKAFGEPPENFGAHVAELHVDVSRDRLRARFLGQGWPVPAGSEVRLRRDKTGVYVFDHEGGRSLPSREMATWFQGGPLRRGVEPIFRARPATGDDALGPGPLMCALLAEWTNRPRESIERRCGQAGVPLAFWVGLLYAERTADVPMTLPAQALRADAASPPELPEGGTSHLFYNAEDMSRMRYDWPARLRRDDEHPERGVLVENRGRARAIVLVRGVPMGWLDAGATMDLSGLLPGRYTIGAIRPLGTLALRAKRLDVPAYVGLR